MPLHNELTVFSYQDPRISFFGKWQEEEGCVTSYGTVTFIKLRFEGRVIGVEGSSAAPVYAYLDGEQMLLDFEGKVYLHTSFGVHSLVIKVFADRAFFLRGFEAEALLEPVEIKRPYVKFIGDSITNAAPGFFTVTGELLGADYSNDSVGGMSLSDGMGWPKEKSPKVGMESYYFRTCRTQFDTVYENYAFRFDSVPDACVVFLGTNDYLDCPEDYQAGNVPHFAAHYAAFIEKLTKHYPTAKFYIFEPLSDKYCRKEGIEAAFAIMKEKLGDKVELLPTDTWGVALSPDGTHPSAEGYADLGVKLAAYLAPKL